MWKEESAASPHSMPEWVVLEGSIPKKTNKGFSSDHWCFHNRMK